MEEMLKVEEPPAVAEAEALQAEAVVDTTLPSMYKYKYKYKCPLSAFCSMRILMLGELCE